MLRVILHITPYLKQLFQHHWHYGQDKSLLLGTVLTLFCIVGSAASLASRLQSTLSLPLSPGTGLVFLQDKLPQFENHWSIYGTTISVFLLFLVLLPHALAHYRPISSKIKSGDFPAVQCLRPCFPV